MYVRKLMARNESDMVSIPKEVMRATGLRRGDSIFISVVGERTIVLQRVDPVKIPDRIVREIREQQTVVHG